MTNWVSKTIGEILELSYGKPLEAKDRDDNGSFPVYGANGVKTYSTKALSGGPSIIVGRKGSAGELNLCEGPFWPLDVTYYVEHDKSETDLYFLYYMLSRMDLPSLAKGVKPGINRNDVYSLECALPPLEEQKRIVTLLDDATARISELTECYEQARTHANNLFTSALRDELEGNPDWPVKTLGDLLTVQNGYAFDSKYFSPGGKIGLIRIRDLKSGVNTETRFDGPYGKEFVVSAGDYLIGMDGEFRCYEWKGEPALLNQRVCRLQGFGKLLEPRFLFYAINKFLKDIEDVTGYTTVKHLSSKSILAIEMSLPPLEEQRRIVSSLDGINAKTAEIIAAYDAKLTATKNLRQSILEAAFSGDL